MTRKKIDVSNVTDAYRKDYHDPSGSYTGVPVDGKMPTQDADDL